MYGMVSKKTTETGIIADGSLPTRYRPVAFTWSPWLSPGLSVHNGSQLKIAQMEQTN